MSVRTPPAVSWPVRDDRHWRTVHAVLAALAAGSSGGWLVRLIAGGDPLVTLCALAAAVAGAAMGWRVGRQGAGELEWTGSQWRWREAHGPAAPIAAPDVMLDLQGWMLLRWRPYAGGRPSWRSVGCGVRQPAGQAADGGVRWTAFRAAVYFAASRSDRRSGPESPFP